MSVSKITNDGWPDPTDWINRLHRKMAERQADYEAETDVSLKRNKAGGMLSAVMLALLELPPFKSDTVHLPLKDMLLFLSDLEKGRDHPWSATVNVGGSNITTTAMSEVKAWVRAAYGLLTRNGFKPVEAYRRIAQGLTASGRHGRKGKPVRWQRVQDWCLASEKPYDQIVQAKLGQYWDGFRAATAAVNIVDVRGTPVLERDVAGQFVDLVWSQSHLRDRSFSVG